MRCIVKIRDLNYTEIHQTMNSKQLYIVLGAIFILLLAGFGFLAFSDKNKVDVATQNAQNPIPPDSNVQTQQPAAVTPSESPTDQPSTSTAKTEILNGQNYKNTKYGFELKVPKNSTIESETQSDSTTEYIRIQNYTDGGEIGLKSGEYYLEIYIGPESQCQEDLEQSREVTINGAVGYRGLGLPGGDAGGQRYALCIIRNEKRFFVQATEDSETGNIANSILDSFKFSK